MTTNKKIVYVDMDDVLCDFLGAFNKAKADFPDVIYPQSKPNFFRNLKPIEGAIEGFMYLYTHPLLDVYILTAPSVRNPLCYTEKRLWVEDYLGIEVAQELIIASDKGLLKGHYLIDDMDCGKGQEDFDGELLQYGSECFKDWKMIEGWCIAKFEQIDYKIYCNNMLTYIYKLILQLL